MPRIRLLAHLGLQQAQVALAQVVEVALPGQEAARDIDALLHQPLARRAYRRRIREGGRTLTCMPHALN